MTALKLILIGIFFVVSGVFVAPQLLAARAGAGEATASGTVVDLHESTGRSQSRLCSPEAMFAVDGTTYTARADYSSSTCPSIGSSVTVVYPTADPSDARVPASRGSLLMLGVFPVVGLALVTVGVCRLVVGMRRLGT